MKTITLFFFLVSNLLWANPETPSVGEQEFIDFSKIQSILKNDKLAGEAAQKVKVQKQKKDENQRRLIAKYDLPEEEKLMQFLSEIWLVNNAQILKWDVEKPDYGLEEYLRNFLQKLGIYNHKFRILFLDSPSVVHMGLPTLKDESIFLVSIPFIKQLDLSKQEISILLLEDYLRLQKGFFVKKLSLGKFRPFMGNNFYPDKLTKEDFNLVFKDYSKIVFEKGFNFEEQFEVTTALSTLLKNDLSLWNAYVGMLHKIDDLVKTDPLYKRYSDIFPSPEMQINWLVPRKERP